MRHFPFFLSLAFSVAFTQIQAGDPLVDRLFEKDPRLQELRRRYEQQQDQSDEQEEDLAESEPQKVMPEAVSRRQSRASVETAVAEQDETIVPHVRNKRRRRHIISLVEPKPTQETHYQDTEDDYQDCYCYDDDCTNTCYSESYPMCCYEPRFCGSLTLGAEILYWKACSELLGAGSRTSRFTEKSEFVMTSMEPTPPIALAASSFNTGVIFATEANRHKGTAEVSDDWHVGVKLGGRYQTSCRCWDIGLRWTYLSPEESRSHKADAKEEIIVPALFEECFLRDTTIFQLPDDREPFPTVPLYPMVQKAKDRFDLCFHLIDFEISRPLCLCDCFFIRPHLGAKIVVIEEKLHTSFDGKYCIKVSDEDRNIDFSGHAKRKYCFTGAGPRVGVNLQWNMFCGVGFYGNVAAAIAAGDREADQSLSLERMSVKFDEDSTNVGDVKQKTRLVDDTCIQSITDVEVGISWCSCFCNGRYGFRIKLGWDTHYVMDVTSVYGSRVATSGLIFGASTHF